MTLRDLHRALGATTANDGIPLHYGDLKTEYYAALEKAILMDRSHQARLALAGRDRLAIPNRMSTNNLLEMAIGEGRPTIFTNPNARIIDRAILCNRGEDALLFGEPGRGDPLYQYLQKNIFFNDQLTVQNLAETTRQFVLHGPVADKIIEAWVPGAAGFRLYQAASAMIGDSEVYIVRGKPFTAPLWTIVVTAEKAAPVWMAILDAGKSHDLRPAGSLTYNTLRIRAGHPAAGHELSPEFIPLEIGLWDEVSFSKGCYTGQEIIARMESRSRLTKIMVMLELDDYVVAPADIFESGKRVGTLTSSVTSPDDEIFAVGVIKTQYAVPGQKVAVAKTEAYITTVAGVQPTIDRPDISES